MSSVRSLTSVWYSPMVYFFEFATANDMIVVFPDVHSSFWNPFGCFDSYGYTGSDFMTKDSDQGKFLMRVIE